LKSTHQHLEILDRLVAGDRDKAAELLAQHLRDSKEFVIRIIADSDLHSESMFDTTHSPVVGALLDPQRRIEDVAGELDRLLRETSR
jgi:DNA-binding FadR family transcriptional regulator